MQCRTPRMLNAECISVSSSDVGRDVGEEDVACACDRGASRCWLDSGPGYCLVVHEWRRGHLVTRPVSSQSC